MSFLELFLRFIVKIPSHILKNADLEISSQIPGIFAPVQDFVRVDMFKEKLPYRIFINSNGMRGNDFELKKSKDTFRILCLGDSYTFGVYVDQGKTYPEQLESILNENKSGPKFEIINGGVSGYTLSDEYDYYKNKLHNLDPDFVIVGFVMNDVSDYSRPISSWQSQQKNAKYWAERKYTAFVRNLLIDTSIYNGGRILLAYMKVKGGKSETTPNEYKYNIINDEYNSNTTELWNKYFKTLTKFKKDLDEKGIGFLLMIFPVYAQIHENATVHPQEYLVRRCSEIGVGTLDLTSKFREYSINGKKLFNMPIEDHPTSEGYSVTAKAIKKYLSDSKVISNINDIN